LGVRDSKYSGELSWWIHLVDSCIMLVHDLRFQVLTFPPLMVKAAKTANPVNRFRTLALVLGLLCNL
jgi:hypothetical protein